MIIVSTMSQIIKLLWCELAYLHFQFQQHLNSHSVCVYLWYYMYIFWLTSYITMWSYKLSWNMFSNIANKHKHYVNLNVVEIGSVNKQVHITIV